MICRALRACRLRHARTTAPLDVSIERPSVGTSHAWSVTGGWIDRTREGLVATIQSIMGPMRMNADLTKVRGLTLDETSRTPGEWDQRLT